MDYALKSLQVLDERNFEAKLIPCPSFIKSCFDHCFLDASIIDKEIFKS